MHKRRERRSCYCPAWPGEAAAAGGLALRGRGGRGEGTAGGQSLPWPCGGGGGARDSEGHYEKLSASPRSNPGNLAAESAASEWAVWRQSNDGADRFSALGSLEEPAGRGKRGGWALLGEKV